MIIFEWNNCLSEINGHPEETKDVNDSYQKVLDQSLKDTALLRIKFRLWITHD